MLLQEILTETGLNTCSDFQFDGVIEKCSCIQIMMLMYAVNSGKVVIKYENSRNKENTKKSSSNPHRTSNLCATVSLDV